MNEQDFQELSQMGNSSNSVCTEIERIIQSVKEKCLHISELLKDNYPELSKLWVNFSDNLLTTKPFITTAFKEMGEQLKEYVVKEKENTLCKEEIATITEFVSGFEKITKTMMEQKNDQPILDSINNNNNNNQNPKKELVTRIQNTLKKSRIIEKGNGSILTDLYKLKEEKKDAA